jgi:GAF domain-containing protein/HAMP domain-containing protein
MDTIKRHPQPKSNSIQSHLLLVIVLLAAVILIVMITITAVLGIKSSRDQVMRQLQSVAALKDNELQTWAEDIRSNLSDILIEPVNATQWSVILQNPDQVNSLSNQNSKDSLKKRFDLALKNTNLFEEFFLMDSKGIVVVSTDASQQGQYKSDQQYSKKGLLGFFINPPFNEPTQNKLTMVAVLPVVSETGETLGVFGGRIDMRKLNDLMLARDGLGQTGQTYLVQQNHALLTESRFPGWEPGKLVTSRGINDAIQNGAKGFGTYSSYRGVPVLGAYRWLPDLQMVLVAEQDQAEALHAAYTALISNSIAAVVALIAVILAALIATRRITEPIGELAHAAEQVAAGNLTISANAEQGGEIGVLARSFNSMTSQLRTLIGNLEQSVSARTQELERRSTQLQVAAEIARDVTSLRDLQEILENAVNKIRDRFGFYHAGIFLVDEQREYAILRAATGEAGLKLMEQEHKLKVGQVGIVGYVTGTGNPRIALDVGADAVYFKNPLLPETHSEMALPLRANDRIIGALDVQSKAEVAFDKDDIRVLQTMADQLAVAIENARLFEEMEQTLLQLEISQSQATREAWHGFAQRRSPTIGYRFRGLGIAPILELLPGTPEGMRQEKPVVQSDLQQGKSLAVPIKIRDQVLGTMNVRFNGDELPEEAETTYSEIATRLSIALENARLLEETRLRSEQLNFLQEITSAAASHLKVQELLDDIAQRILAGFSLRYCSVFLFDDGRQTGTCVTDISRDPGTQDADYKGVCIPLDQNNAFQTAIRSQKAAVYYDVQNNPNTKLIQKLMETRSLQTLIIAPLISQNESTGVIVMEIDDGQRQITSEDKLLLDQVSLQVSVTMVVARLFEQTKQKAEREQLISDITAKIRASTNVDLILQTSIQEISQALRLTHGAIQLKGEDGVDSDE